MLIKKLKNNYDDISYVKDKKTGKNLPVVVKRCNRTGTTQTMMPSIILENHRGSLPADASTAGGIMKPHVRESLRINDNAQRMSIKCLGMGDKKKKIKLRGL